MSTATFWFKVTDHRIYITAEVAASTLFEYSLWEPDTAGNFRPMWRYAADENSELRRVTVTLQNGSTRRFRVEDGATSPNTPAFSEGPLEIGERVFLASPEKMILLGRVPPVCLAETTNEGIVHFRANDEMEDRRSPPESTWIADLISGKKIEISSLSFVNKIKRFGDGFVCVAGIREGDDYRSYIVRLSADGSTLWRSPGANIVHVDAERDVVIFTNDGETWTLNAWEFERSSAYDQLTHTTLMARRRGGSVITGPKIEGSVREMPSPPGRAYLASHAREHIHVFRFDTAFTHFCTIDKPTPGATWLSAQTVGGIDVVSYLEKKTAKLSFVSPYSRHDIDGALGSYEGCFVTRKEGPEHGHTIIERVPIVNAALPLIEKDIAFLKASAEALQNPSPLEPEKPSLSEPKQSYAASAVQLHILNKMMVDAPELLAPSLRVRSSKTILDTLLYAYFPEAMKEHLQRWRGSENNSSRLGIVDTTSISPAGGDPRHKKHG